MPPVTRFAFFDGIYITIYRLEYIFFYLHFSIVLSEMETKDKFELVLQM